MLNLSIVLIGLVVISHSVQLYLIKKQIEKGE